MHEPGIAMLELTILTRSPQHRESEREFRELPLARPQKGSSNPSGSIVAA
jgi:hypothetical protein